MTSKPKEKTNLETRYQPHFTTWLIFSFEVSVEIALMIFLTQNAKLGFISVFYGLIFISPLIYSSYRRWLYLVLKIKVRMNHIELPLEVKVEYPVLFDKQTLITDELIIENGIPTKLSFFQKKNYSIPLNSILAEWKENDLSGKN